MKRNRWIVEVIVAAMVIVFACYVGVMFLKVIDQENTCWRAGYETPISYAGEIYCFGHDGKPEVMSLARLQEITRP